MASNVEITEFIRSAFRSVWSLELVLLMAEGGERGWSRNDLVTALRASELIVARATEELTAAGLIITDSEGKACFRPTSDQHRRLVAEAGALYARSPNKIRRIIVESGSGGLSAFADAFRIRKD
ncbi:MAG: hypothetical protein EOP83_31835 [Verrucomicrobiaceae bacterium]|nr:MAG: hypothetical protein EOP83_31835 [Verrucomicrobiaceae bacterium]